MLQNNHIQNVAFVLTLSFLPPPFTTLPHRVHPPPRVSSSYAYSQCAYSQCAVHTAMGPCTKGHFIHAGTYGPGVPLLLLLLII
jgi:hypothetical protein